MWRRQEWKWPRDILRFGGRGKVTGHGEKFMKGFIWSRIRRERNIEKEIRLGYLAAAGCWVVLRLGAGEKRTDREL